MSSTSGAETPNYKDTIRLPQTDFPMKGNLPKAEPQFVARWKEQDVYRKMVERNAGKKKFVMPDGPPYANGHIHVGHVLNKVLKDIVIKYRNMKGEQAAFVPGWDCHGLPIELKVAQKLGSERAKKTPAAIRDLCRQEAHHWIAEQKDQFVRLGILGDWDNPYLTLNPSYEAAEVRVLARILENGILYRGEKPVYWCPALETALAAAEIEYQDKKSPSIYVKFAVPEPPTEWTSQPSLRGKNFAFVIWTTTPWTLPANHAIAVHPEFTYGFYEVGDEVWILASELSESLAKILGREFTLLTTMRGQSLEGVQAAHPFMNRRSLVILGEHVSLDAGTGCVHTAPGHGLEDYVAGLKYGLPVDSPVDAAGRFQAQIPKYAGMKIWEANPLIVQDLAASGHLVYHAEITHSYPHNPRSKTPLIFRATPQWFIRMDDPKYPLRDKALTAIEADIQFFPGWGRQRLEAMIRHTPDWCLSRQRLWGVPIPVFYCDACEEPLADASVMRRVADLMENSGRGLEAYHELPVTELVGESKCSKCGSASFRRGPDILDVWFDSGVCHAAVQRQRQELGFPADIYLEGSDQHRGWFQTSLLSSLAATGEVPFRALITHGFVNDAQGYKMSKSRGNVINPAQVFEQYGAEILRLWVAYEDYGQDVSVGPEIITRVTETYRRFRNTTRFMLGNLADFTLAVDAVKPEAMTPLDRWILHELNQLIGKVQAAFESYDFYKVYHALNTFYTVNLSALYLDILKDRLYTWRADGLPRRSAQTAIHYLLDVLLRLQAPILSFLSEEAYDYFAAPGKQGTIFLREFPETVPGWQDPALAQKMARLLDIRREASKVLEEMRKNREIGSSLDAKVTLAVPPEQWAVLDEFKEHLREFLIVSQVEITQAPEFAVRAAKAEGEKCVRCWHYSVNTGKLKEFPGVCPKCVEALEN